MERIETMMIQSSERVLGSVSLRIQGMNTTMGNMKDDGDDRYNQMNERTTNIEQYVHDGRFRQQRVRDESKSWRILQDTRCGRTELIHQMPVINSHPHHRQLSLHKQPRKQRAGDLMLPSSCLDGSITRVGPG